MTVRIGAGVVEYGQRPCRQPHVTGIGHIDVVCRPIYFTRRFCEAGARIQCQGGDGAVTKNDRVWRKKFEKRGAPALESSAGQSAGPLALTFASALSDSSAHGRRFPADAPALEAPV